MSNFLKRTLSGTIFVIGIVLAIALGKYTFALVFGVLMLATMYEFYRLAVHAKVKPQLHYGMLLGAILFIANYFYATGGIGTYIYLGLIPLLFSVFIIEIYRNHSRPLHNIAVTLLGILYIAFPFSLLNFFTLSYAHYTIGYNSQIIMGLFFLIWANDAGAYIIGVSVGRRRLFPRVSPRKSWEGLIGGIAFSIITAWVISLFFFDISLLHWVAVGLIASVSGVFGDLIESMLKRSIGIKDSGRFLPGHGGFLDRFDGFLLAVPIVFVYLEIMMLI